MDTLILFAQQAPNDGGILGGLLSFMAFVWIFAIAASIFWLWMLVDVLVSKRETNEKILWFLVVFFLHVVGAVIYLVVARQRSGSAAVGAAG
jgi:hypothetical protein